MQYREPNGTVIKRLVPKPKIFLDPNRQSPQAEDFSMRLRSAVVGQDRAINNISQMYQIFLAGMNPKDRPIGTMLFLGPTGSGKTKSVEAAAEVLFEKPNSIVKIDCAEFQHSHEVAKLIGAPPGFLGHRETAPLLSQARLDWAHTDKIKLTFLLFDEIEKASDSLWQIMLGIMDKAVLHLGDNRKVDFTSTILIMTSNLGSKEMSELIDGGIGFAPKKVGATESAIDQKIYQTGLESAKRRFSPEFMNRIDKVVVFRSLQDKHLQEILELELKAVQDRITKYAGTKFIFECSPEFKQFLLREGTDLKYGARHLKRSIERYLVYPISNLVATEQLELGDFLTVDFDQEYGTGIFRKQIRGSLVNSTVDTTYEVAETATAVSTNNNPYSNWVRVNNG